MTVDVWASPAPTALEAWGDEMAAAGRIARALASTPFIPQSLRVFDENRVYQPDRTAAVVAAALLTGQELGLSPMASLRSIDVVNGTPALRALAFRALVLVRGHELWVAESTTTRAVVSGRRKGSDNVQTSVWTMDRARGLGLAGKQNWRTQPGAMLVARATAECARWIAPEAVLGLAYTAEEVADGPESLVAEPTPEPSAETPEAPPRARRARRARVPATPPEPNEAAVVDAPLPPIDEPPLPEDEPTPEPGPPPPNATNPRMITASQRTAIHAGLGELGITDRTEKLAMLSGIAGDDIHSSLDLTFEQARVTLDYLADLRTQRDTEPER